METIQNILDLAQKYWVVTLVVTLIILRLIPRRSERVMTSSSQLFSSVEQARHFARTGSGVVESKIEFTSSDPAFGEVMRALFDGNKIEAIKLVRAAKGLSLIDAKALVEALDSTKHIRK